MCSTAQMRSRTIAGGARERDSLSRQQSGAAVFTPHRSARCSASKCCTYTAIVPHRYIVHGTPALVLPSERYNYRTKIQIR